MVLSVVFDLTASPDPVSDAFSVSSSDFAVKLLCVAGPLLL